MHTQLNLFERQGDSRHSQPEMFTGRPVVADLHCECGAALIETDNYLICPACLGKLIPDGPDDERDGNWFHDEDAER